MLRRKIPYAGMAFSKKGRNAMMGTIAGAMVAIRTARKSFVEMGISNPVKGRNAMTGTRSMAMVATAYASLSLGGYLLHHLPSAIHSIGGIASAILFSNLEW